MLIFIEDNTNDDSQQVLKIKMAEDIRANIQESDFYHQNILEYINSSSSTFNFELSQDTLKQLVQTGKVETNSTINAALFTGLRGLFMLQTLPAKGIGWVATKLGEGIAHLQIPEKVWDTQSEDYLFSQENLTQNLTLDTNHFDALLQSLQNDTTQIELNDFIPDFIKNQIEIKINQLKNIVTNYNQFVEKTIEKWFDTSKAISDFLNIKEKVALITGIYNGLIDFIASIFKFVGQILEAPFDILNNWQHFLETYDNIFESIRSIDWDNFWTNVKMFFTQIAEKLKTEWDNLDTVRIAYYIGFGIAFIGSMFIPIAGWAGKIAKIDKIIPEEFLQALQKGLKSLQAEGKNIKFKVLNSIEKLLELLAKGTESITEFFSKLADDIAEWFLKNKEKLRLVDKTPTSIKNLTKIYGKGFVKAGSNKVFRKYTDEFTKVVKQANTSAQKNIFKNDFKIKKRKMSIQKYIDIRVQQYINFEKGAKFEALFVKIYGGLKPADALVTSITKRFLDVLKRTTMYELKAGFITVPKNAFTKKPSQLTGFAKQVYKDMEILRDSRNIKNLEYHIIEGISDDAVKFIHKIADDQKVLDKVKIVLYK